MNNFKKWTLGAALTVLCLSTANAGLITVNGTAVNALEINTSFEDFYQFDSPNTFSANTGLEISNQIVMFIGMVGSEFGIYTIYSGPGGVAGGGDNSVSGDGSVIFWEDAKERDLSFDYGSGKTDGFVVGQLFGDDWNVDYTFSNVSGINGITIYTFDNSGQATVASELSSVPSQINVSSEATSSAVLPVPAPGSMVLCIIMGVLAVFRFRKVN